MAGNYPDVPAYRFPYDRDGTVGFAIDNPEASTQLTQGELANLNDESDSNGYVLTSAQSGGGTVRIGLVFPEQRDIQGVFLTAQPALFLTFDEIEVSTDTTDLIDGTWTTFSGVVNHTQVIPIYRNAIDEETHTGIRGIRVNYSTTSSGTRTRTVDTLHVYGDYVPGENPDRLALWHPTLDEPVDAAYFDFGNVARSTSTTKTFRVKNLSTAFTAHDIRVATEILTDGSPSVVAQHTLSENGVDYFAQINVGDIAPDGLTGELTVKLDTPTNAAMGVWALRLFAEADTWS